MGRAGQPRGPFSFGNNAAAHDPVLLNVGSGERPIRVNNTLPLPLGLSWRFAQVRRSTMGHERRAEAASGLFCGIDAGDRSYSDHGMGGHDRVGSRRSCWAALN